MASDFTKPNKVHTLFMHEISSKMWPLDVSELFMIGKKSSEKLKKLNINTIYDLAHTDKDFLIKNFKKMGIMMWEYANGIDESMVEYIRDNPKSISSSTVLPYDYKNLDQIYAVFKSLVDDVVRRLKNSHMFTNTVGVGIKYKDLSKISKQKKLDNSTDDIDYIYKMVVSLFNELYDKETGVRALCVSLNDLDLVKKRQLSIFDKDFDIKTSNNDNKINEIIDSLEKKYGKNLLDFGTNKFSK